MHDMNGLYRLQEEKPITFTWSGRLATLKLQGNWTVTEFSQAWKNGVKELSYNLTGHASTFLVDDILHFKVNLEKGMVWNEREIICFR